MVWGGENKVFTSISLYILFFYSTYGVLRMASLSALKVKDKQNVNLRLLFET